MNIIGLLKCTVFSIARNIVIARGKIKKPSKFDGFFILGDGKVLFCGKSTVKIYRNCILTGGIRQCRNVQFTVTVGPHAVPALACSSGADQLSVFVTNDKQRYDGVPGTAVGLIELYNKGSLRTDFEAGSVVGV